MNNNGSNSNSNSNKVQCDASHIPVATSAAISAPTSQAAAAAVAAAASFPSIEVLDESNSKNVVFVPEGQHDGGLYKQFSKFKSLFHPNKVHNSPAAPGPTSMDMSQSQQMMEVIEDGNTVGATAAAATTLLPESLSTLVPDLPSEGSVDTTTLSSVVSVPNAPHIHTASGKNIYQQAPSEHRIHMQPIIFHHAGAHHHVKVSRHHVLKKHMESQLQVEVDEEIEVTTLHDLIAGGIAGSASVVVGHPFDTIKVRMQTSGGAGVASWNSKAIAGLFRGMGPPLSAAGLVNALVFSSYGWSNRMWDDHYGINEQTAAEQAAAKEAESFNWKAYFCGCFAGLTQTFVLCPTEHVKCRLQVQANSASTPNIYSGPMDAARQIVKSHGVSGLFRGWTVTAWREVPAFGLYFTSYDALKLNIEKRLEKADINQPWIASGLSGGTSGCLTWAVIYPFDVIKSRIQTSSLDSKASIMGTGKQIFKEGGTRALFRGLGVTLCRAFPVNGVIFPVYELCVLQLTGGDRMLD